MAPALPALAVFAKTAAAIGSIATGIQAVRGLFSPGEAAAPAIQAPDITTQASQVVTASREAADRERQRRAAASGRNSTILSDMTQRDETTRRTLLGG